MVSALARKHGGETDRNAQSTRSHTKHRLAGCFGRAFVESLDKSRSPSIFAGSSGARLTSPRGFASLSLVCASERIFVL